jgi:hypothetical protein
MTPYDSFLTYRFASPVTNPRSNPDINFNFQKHFPKTPVAAVEPEGKFQIS